MNKFKLEENRSKEVIKNIPKIQGDSLPREFIIEKLLEAESNKDIIMLARGDGRYKWKTYIKSEDLFYWGYKSEHSHKAVVDNFLLRNILDEEDVRRLLNPYEYSEDLFRALFEQIRYSLNRYKEDLSIKERDINSLSIYI